MTIYGQLVKELDDQIERLTAARNALAGINGNEVHRNEVHRKQRIMSADARERIAEAQRKRWARVRRMKKSK